MQSVEFLKPGPEWRCGEKGELSDWAATALLVLVARQQRVPIKLLLHPSRGRASIAGARQLAMYLMHVSLGRGLNEVGSFFGRDRTTVGHACARIEDLRDSPAFDAEVSRLEAAVLLRASQMEPERAAA